MVRFVHTADWQLGMARHYLGSDAQARFGAARLDSIGSIGELAEKEGCDFVVVCGDVFESNHIERQVILRAFAKMAASPSVTFYLLPGNHDPIDASSIYRSGTFREKKPDNVVVLLGTEPVQAAPGVELVPAPWPNKHPDRDLVDAACRSLQHSDALRIVVGHGAVDSMSPDSDDPKVISLGLLEERIKAGLIHYVALGDRHSKTDVGASGRVWYSGAPEPTDYTEVDPGKVLIVDLGSDRLSVEPRHVGTWHFEPIERHLSGDEDIEALSQWFSALPDRDRTIARLSLVGQLSVAQKARLDALLEDEGQLLAALEIWERSSDLVVVPDVADMDNFGLSGFAREALSDLREMAESGEQAPAAREALGLLYRLARTAS